MKKITKFFLFVICVIAITSCTSKAKASETESEAAKVLVLYYSQTGTTKAVAEQLQQLLGADIEAIEAVEPYTGDFQQTIARCQLEMQKDSLPALRTIQSDLSKYDTIYLGYPIWFGTYARPMLAFIKSANLEGKTIIPFCTFGSGGLESTVESLKTDQPKANILTGYGVRTARIASMPKELDRFLKENGLIKGKVEALPDYSAQQPVTEETKQIFNAACSDYQFPLGTPVTVGSRTTADGTDYKYTVSSQGMNGGASTSTIYVTVANGGKPEFTRVVR